MTEPRTWRRLRRRRSKERNPARDNGPGNDTIALEEPIVRGLVDELPPGLVLDAACGTGRHLAYLGEIGREVVGVDASEAML